MNDGDQTRQVSKREYAVAWSIILFLGYVLPVIMWELFVGYEPNCDLFGTTRFFAIALFAPYTAMVTILICIKFLWKSKFKSVSEGVVWFLNISPSWLRITNWISLSLTIVLLRVIAMCPHSEYVILGFSISFAAFIGSFFVIAGMWWSKKTDDSIHGKLDPILDALTDPDPSDPTKRINKLDKLDKLDPILDALTDPDPSDPTKRINKLDKLDPILDALTDPDPSDPTKRINKLDKIEKILKEIRDNLKRER